MKCSTTPQALRGDRPFFSGEDMDGFDISRFVAWAPVERMQATAALLSVSCFELAVMLTADDLPQLPRERLSRQIGLELAPFLDKGVDRSLAVENALQSLIEKGMLRVMTPTDCKMVSEYVASLNLSVPVIEGMPEPGDIDFTLAYGLAIGSINRLLYGEYVDQSPVCPGVDWKGENIVVGTDEVTVRKVVAQFCDPKGTPELKQIGPWADRWFQVFRYGYVCYV